MARQSRLASRNQIVHTENYLDNHVVGKGIYLFGSDGWLPQGSGLGSAMDSGSATVSGSARDSRSAMVSGSAMVSEAWAVTGGLGWGTVRRSAREVLAAPEQLRNKICICDSYHLQENIPKFLLISKFITIMFGAYRCTYCQGLIPLLMSFKDVQEKNKFMLEHCFKKSYNQ